MATDDASGLIRRVSEAVDDDARWKIRILVENWLCPFCGEVGVEGDLDGSDLEERIARHLRDDCPAWEGPGTEPMTLRDLRPRAIRVAARRQVARNLGRSESWTLTDAHRRWVCPYCARPTEIPILAGEPGPEVASAVEDHLVSCPGYREGRGKERPLSALRKVRRRTTRAQQLVEPIRKRMARDPVWRQEDSNGRWICPYCGDSIGHIDISTSLLLYETAPGQVAKHLVQACPEFRARQRARSKRRDDGEAEDDETGRESGSRPVAPARTGSSEELPSDTAWEELRQELAAVSARGSGGHFDASDASLDAVGTGIPEVDGLEIRLLDRPAPEPTGAFHLAFADPSGRLVVALARLEGGGAGPFDAAVARGLRTVLRRRVGRGDAGPAEGLDLLAGKLGERLGDRRLVVACGVLDTEEGTFVHAARGTPPIFLTNPVRTEPFRDLDADDRPIRAGEAGETTEHRVDLLPGDLLVAADPGLLDLPGVRRKPFGLDRFRDLVRSYGNHEADYFVYQLVHHLGEFLGGDPPDRDLLCLAVRYEAGIE